MPKTLRLHIVGAELRSILSEVEYAERKMERMEREGPAHPALAEARRTVRAIRTAVLGEVTVALEQLQAVFASSVLPAATPPSDPARAIAEAVESLKTALFAPLLALHELIERLERETPGDLLPFLLMAIGTEIYRAYGLIAEELAPAPADPTAHPAAA